MRRFLAYTLFISTILVGCKQESSNTVAPIKITFKKEGELQLKRADTDTLIAGFAIEIADNEYERQTGLMNRESMQDDQAMLFIFDNAAYRSFYMKNTIIPLDIMYFDQDKKLINVHVNTKPFDEQTLPSTAPAKYVLEINGGLTEQLGIAVGDTFEFTQY